jgi:CHAD domain-containing protein
MARATTRTHPKVPAPSVIAAALGASWEHVETELERYRRDPEQAGSHDLRVGLRRLHAAIELAVALEPEALPDKLTGRLKRLLGALSPLRDIEIQREAVEKHALEPETRQTLLGWLRRREKKLGKKIQRRVARFPLPETRLGMAAAAAVLEARARDPTPSAQLVVLGAVAERYAAFDRRRRASNDHDLEGLHRTRIAFKKYRYAVELAGPLLRPPARARKGALKRFQDELGALQDSVVVLELFARRQATQGLADEVRVEQGNRAAHVRSLLAAQVAGAVPEFSEYLP